MIIFPNIDAITTGFHFNFPQRTQAQERAEWYDSKYGSLFPEPSTQNGLKLLRPDAATDDLPSLAVFKEASDFIRNAPSANYRDILRRAGTMVCNKRTRQRVGWKRMP